MNKEAFDAALNKARHLCAKSEKCADDLHKKNATWKLPSSAMEQIIQRLKEEKFLDHKRYALAYANDKLKFNHWGRKKIQFALKQKGIEEEYIKAALDQINEKTYQQILEVEGEKKLEKLKNKDKNVLKQKLIQYLVQKGFEYGKVFDFVENRLNMP
jgi:regulatory protein